MQPEVPPKPDNDGIGRNRFYVVRLYPVRLVRHRSDPDRFTGRDLRAGHDCVEYIFAIGFDMVIPG
jgi:hypothetical protein